MMKMKGSFGVKEATEDQEGSHSVTRSGTRSTTCLVCLCLFFGLFFRLFFPE